MLWADDRLKRRLSFILGLALALGLFPLSGWSWRTWHPGPNLTFNIICKWGVTIAIIFWVILGERRSLRSIGLIRMKPIHWLIGMGTFLAGGLLFWLSTLLAQLLGLTGSLGGIELLSRQPTSMLILLIGTAGITEEVIFRGYSIERLGSLIGSRLWAGLITATIFTGLHLRFWGWGMIIPIGFWALLVTGVYLWTHRLGVVILAHLLNDLFFLVILRGLLIW